MTSDDYKLTSNPMGTATSPSNHWIAVDVNSHYIRVVVVDDRRILGAFEARSGPRQAVRTIRFVRDTLPVDARPTLVGRYYDRWESSLHTALVMEFGPVTWINPNLLHITQSEVERWNSMFRTYRALLYAVCAQEGTKRELHPFHDRFDILCTWKNAVLHDLTEQFSP